MNYLKFTLRQLLKNPGFTTVTLGFFVLNAFPPSRAADTQSADRNGTSRAVLGKSVTLNEFVNRYAKEHHFNGCILVHVDGTNVFSGSFGTADRSFDVPCTLDTRFKIASITKAFTGVLVLQMVDEGRLDLAAPVKQYLADYSGEAGDRVTIHRLLNHTSGLANLDAGNPSVDAAEKNGMPQYQLPHTPSELIARYCSGKLQHEPGKNFDYNNADYVILGRIIEVVSGKPFEAVLRQRMLSPLGMGLTGLLHHGEIVSRLAPTYFSKDANSPLSNDLPIYIGNFFAAGGMYSTVGDLMKFAEALYGGKLLSSRSLELMFTSGLGGYGYGLWIGQHTIGGKSYRNMHRPGRIMGTNGSLYRFEGVGFNKAINIVILANTDQVDLDRFSWAILKAVLE